MLKEIENPKQKSDEGYRRIFTDSFFDLYVWYDDNKTEIDGFQLCYNKNSKKEKAITWRKEYGMIHEKIDSGEGQASKKMSPTSYANGDFNFDSIADKFKLASKEIDEDVASFIYEKLKEYHLKKSNENLQKVKEYYKKNHKKSNKKENRNIKSSFYAKIQPFILIFLVFTNIFLVIKVFSLSKKEPVDNQFITSQVIKIEKDIQKMSNKINRFLNQKVEIDEQFKDIKIINASFLNVRKGPGLKYKRISFLRKGKEVFVWKMKQGWAYIKYKISVFNANQDIKETFAFGWVHARHIK